MRILAVIPARHGASRFPGKPLVPIAGRPLVQRVYEAARSCDRFGDVVVATDSDAIADCVRGFGGDVVMTRDDHPTGTDRVAEVAASRPDADVVVNVQGDQPFVTAAMLGALVEPYLAGGSPPMTTLGCPLAAADVDDPNVVKVVLDRHGDALYFSRSPIPHYRTPGPAPVLHHLGLYAFTREFVLRYPTLTPTPLEQREGLEQLRALEHGYRIRVCRTAHAVLEINTPEDHERAEALLAGGIGG